MGLMNKFKNMFTEEIEEEPIKKEVIQVKIPAPKKIDSSEKKPDNKVEEKSTNSPSLVTEKPKEEKFAFPVFFDDNDFEQIEKPKPPVRQPKKAQPYSGVRSEPIKEVKKFKPTPVISPVYGVLDRNYKKEDIQKRGIEDYYRKNKDLNIDDIRKKAYGTLEDDLETGLINDDTYQKESVYQSDEDMFNDLSILTEDDYFTDPSPVKKETRQSRKRDILTDNIVEEEMNSHKDSKNNDEERDLLGLIDSMYTRGDD